MKINYNRKVNQPNPIPEFCRKADIVDGVEVISYTPAVYPVFPPVDEFSIENMLKAGVSPESLTIHTQTSDRLEGISQIADFAAEAEFILTPNTDTE